MSGSGENLHTTRQPGAPTAALPTPLAQLNPQLITATLHPPHPAPHAQAVMAGLASKDQTVLHLEALLEVTKTAVERLHEGTVPPAHCFPVSTSLKALFDTGTTATINLIAVLADDSPLAGVWNKEKAAFGAGKPAAEGELPQAFTGLTRDHLAIIHDNAKADLQLIARAAGAARAAYTGPQHTHAATPTAPNFAPHVASPLQPAMTGAQYPAYTPQAGTTLLPADLDATAARALSAEHNADVLALYLASAGVAGAPGQGAGGGGGCGAGAGAAGLAFGAAAGGEPHASGLYKAPALNTFLLDKKDNTTQLVLEHGRVTAKKEADTNMTQTQFMKAYMTLIQTSYSHCSEQAMRFFLHLNDLWDKYPHTALMRYERAVRHKCAKHPEIPLDAVHAHIHEFIEHVVPALAGHSHAGAHRYPPKQEEPQHKRGRAASPPGRGGGSSGASGSRSTPPGTKADKPACRDYNSGGCTRGTKCGFPHRCATCSTCVPAGATGTGGVLITRCPVCRKA
jgi:hypothetical protein